MKREGEKEKAAAGEDESLCRERLDERSIGTTGGRDEEESRRAEGMAGVDRERETERAPAERMQAGGVRGVGREQRETSPGRAGAVRGWKSG